MKKILSLVVQIDFILLLMYITSLFIAALFNGFEVKYFDVVDVKDNSIVLNVSKNYEGETIEIKKVFYVNISKENQIVALKSNSGKYIYVPSILGNYKTIVRGLCFATASVFIGFIIITLGLVVYIAKQRSIGNEEVL